MGERGYTATMQKAAQSLYSWLDDASRGRVDRFATRMETAPRSVRDAVVAEWPALDVSLAPIQNGQLRPAVPNSFDILDFNDIAAAGLRVLLFVPTVVVPYELGAPWIHLHEGGDSPDYDYSKDLAKHLRILESIRPLVEDGSIVFAENRRQDVWRYPYWEYFRSYVQGYPWGTVLDDCSVNDPSGDREMEDLAELLALGTAVIEVHEKKASPLALSRDQQRLYQAIFDDFEMDRRHTRAAILASIAVPDLLVTARDLAAVRNSSDALNRLRQAIDGSFGALAEPIDFHDFPQAKAVLADSMTSSVAGLERELRKSSALNTMKGGVRRLGFAAIGAGIATGAGFAFGAPSAGPALGLAGGATVALFETVREGLAERRNLRQQAALWRLSTSFIPADEGEGEPV